jgi:hypothetical protein
MVPPELFPPIVHTVTVLSQHATNKPHVPNERGELLAYRVEVAQVTSRSMVDGIKPCTLYNTHTFTYPFHIKHRVTRKEERNED